MGINGNAGTVESLGLSDAERATVASQLFDRMSYADIAKRDGVSVASVRTRKWRARRRALSRGVVIPKRPPKPTAAQCGSLNAAQI